jgi:hypothetical protein
MLVSASNAVDIFCTLFFLLSILISQSIDPRRDEQM